MKSKSQSILEAKLDKNTVIVRANLDLRIENSEIVDDSKIKAIIPTLNHLVKNNCKVIILSNLGENCSEYNDENSFLPVRFALGRLLNKPIKFVGINSCQNSIKFMEAGDILLIENLCFSPEEFSNSNKIKEEFVKKIAQFADTYVDESFGVNRKLATVQYLPKLLPTFVGINHEAELKAIEKLRKTKKDGFISIVGGKFNEEKKIIIEKLIKKSEKILLGGEVALKFEKKDKETKDLFSLAKENGCELILPDGFIKDSKGFEKDIDKKTAKKYLSIIESAKTVIATGTMGELVNEDFGKGDEEVYGTLSLLTTKEFYKVVGGKSTLAGISKLKIKHKKFNHYSTGIFELISSL